MTFDTQKKTCLSKLYKPDKSRKGDVDKPIIQLIDYLNSLNNYYTTSSCSGRIYIITEAKAKPDVEWLYVSHEKISELEEEKLLKMFPKFQEIEKRVWLRQEGMILHVACRSLESAGILLTIARGCGLRRSGMIAHSDKSKKIIVEICSTEKMEVPISEKKKILITEEYFILLIKFANEKFMQSRKKLDKFFSEIKKNIK